MSDNTNLSGSGIGLGGALFITFLVLKLCKVIDWSWWWVTAPLWGGFALVLGIVDVILGIVGVIFAIALIVGIIKVIFGR